jgi:pimeloyl-ACP methyl ester carboxylesterase
LRPRNVYAASADMAAANEDLEAMQPRYGSIRIPVDILYGRGDHILNPHAQGEAMQASLPSVDLELVAGGHMLPVTAPDVVASFVRRIAAKAVASANAADG